MNEDSKIIKTDYDKYLKFILVIFCFVGIPAFILSYSVYRYFQSNEEQIINNLKTYAQHITNELRRNSDTEQYFCRIFHEYNLKGLNNSDFNVESCVDYCKSFKEQFGDKIDFVVITNKGEIKYNSNPNFYKHPDKVWYDAYHFAKFHFAMIPDLYEKGDSGDVNALKKIFGPQTIFRTLKALNDVNVFSLIWGDYKGNIPPGAVYSFRWGGFFVFISKELLSDKAHLKYFMSNYSSNTDIILGLYDSQNLNKTFWTNKPLSNEQEVKDYLTASSVKDKRFAETDKLYIYQQILSDNYNLLIFSLKGNTNLSLLLKALLVFLLYFVCSWHIIKYFRNTILLNIQGEASISLKIGFLFAFATLIPLLLFALVSHEYELYKREALIKEARVWTTENLLSIEQRYQSYLKSVTHNLDKFVSNYEKALKNTNLTIELVKSICRDFFTYDIHDFFMVASETPYIGATEGLFKYSGPLDSIQFDLSKSFFNPNQKKVAPSELVEYLEKWKFNDYRFLIIVIKKIMSYITGNEITGSAMSKLEIIAEGFMQKPISEIIYNFIEMENQGIIKEWGYGNRIFMAYLNFISLSKKSLPDYIIVTSWWPEDLQYMFVLDIFSKLNRNTLGLKFISFERYQRKFIPEIYNGNSELEAFAKRTSEKPSDELETISYNGETYIVVTLMGKGVDKYSFLGLYPMRNIDNEIKLQKSLLWLLGVFSLILSFGLAQLLSKSFIKPLLILQDGALAIENRRGG